MNKIFLLIAAVFITATQAHSQSIDSAVARRTAIRLKDSLSLTAAQADSIYVISKAARAQKRQVWSTYRGSTDLNQRLLREDQHRDSLYHTIMGDDKYILYYQKRWLYLLTN